MFAPAATVPAPPTNVQAVPRKRAAPLTWTRGSDGGSPLTSQTVRVYQGASLVRTIAVSATATGVTVTGLQAGQAYSFSVVASNAVGSSVESVRSNIVYPR